MPDRASPSGSVRFIQDRRDEAVREFRQRYNVNPDAEELIAMNRARVSAAVRAASLLEVNEEATKDLDLADLASAETVSGHTVSDLGTLRAAAVRGHAIVVLIEDADRRVSKDVVPYDDEYEPPFEPAADVAQRVAAEARSEFSDALLEERARHEADLAELRAEMEQKLGEMAASLTEQHAERLSDETEAARERETEELGSGSAEVEPEPTPTPTEPEFPRQHDALDALASKHKVAWPEGVTKVDEKIAHLQAQGVKPASE